jgi:hypothetical protein
MFRFTIRELVLVTVIVAMGAGWWRTHAKCKPLTEAMNRATEELEAAKARWKATDSELFLLQNELVIRIERQMQKQREELECRLQNDRRAESDRLEYGYPKD